ncbi:MAG: nitroreductase/quinone reductase family protein [Acidimicrobiales bacterium]
MTDAKPPRTDLREFNKGLIADYRANGGTDGDGALQPIVLLSTIGRKSGREYTTPVNVREDGDDLIVAGTKGGYPTHPQWYSNLQSNPELTVEYHGDSWRARAITVDNGPDRDRLFAMMVEIIPGAYGYQDKCRDQRQIPVVRLQRI